MFSVNKKTILIFFYIINALVLTVFLIKNQLYVNISLQIFQLLGSLSINHRPHRVPFALLLVRSIGIHAKRIKRVVTAEAKDFAFLVNPIRECAVKGSNKIARP